VIATCCKLPGDSFILLGDMPSQKPWFADRIYLPEDIDLTPLCLAIIAPVTPGHPEFEEVLDELQRCRHARRKMRPKLAKLLKLWITEFQAGHRKEHQRFVPVKIEPVSDTHFIESMFRSFSHQFTLSGHRIGTAECFDLSINRLARGVSGPAPFSRSWANTDANGRQRIREINYLLREQEFT
jgi:hypothetical protein